MSHNWLRTMTLITNPLTTIGPCMARGKFCAMQSSFQIRIEFMMNTVIAMITVIIKVTTVTILLPPWNVTKGREKGSDVKLYLLQPHCSGSAHCTRMRLHFTCLSRIFRRKRFTGCWLPQMPWDLDFLLPCLIVPSRSSKLALDLDVLLNHVFLKHSMCIEHFHRKWSKTLRHKSSIHYTLHLRGQPTFSVLSPNFGVQTCYTLLQLMLRQAGLKGPFFKLRPPMNERGERINR